MAVASGLWAGACPARVMRQVVAACGSWLPQLLATAALPLVGARDSGSEPTIENALDEALSKAAKVVKRTVGPRPANPPARCRKRLGLIVPQVGSSGSIQAGHRLWMAVRSISGVRLAWPRARANPRRGLSVPGARLWHGLANERQYAFTQGRESGR